MSIDEWLVLIGGALIIGSWIPQIARIIKRKSAEDVSVMLLTLITIGTFALIPHSIVLKDVFFIALNLLAGSAVLLTLFVALYYRFKYKKD